MNHHGSGQGGGGIGMFNGSNIRRNNLVDSESMSSTIRQ